VRNLTPDEKRKMYSLCDDRDIGHMKEYLTYPGSSEDRAVSIWSNGTLISWGLLTFVENPFRSYWEANFYTRKALRERGYGSIVLRKIRKHKKRFKHYTHHTGHFTFTKTKKPKAA
jgi:hypothetical protein